MTDESQKRPKNVLLGEDPGWVYGRRLLRTLASQPRCKLCASPFRAPFGPLMKAIGKAPWPKNPNYCTMCFRWITRAGMGAEIECTLLFADVRGSTSLAENMRPAEFTSLMNRFFESASRILVSNDAIVDKFVGDEVIGIFIPALSGGKHAEHAIAAGRELLAATARSGIPVGAGINTGVCFVGTVGEGDNIDLTAMGDPVNVCARLASAAGEGELLVTERSAVTSNLDTNGIERRDLELRGKSEVTRVFILGAAR